MTTMNASNSDGYSTPIGLAADAVIFTLKDEHLQVLLARRADEPCAGMPALPGGFVGATEDPEETIQRKLQEKTGMATVYAEQLRTYAQPGRDPRGWIPSIAYLALVPNELLPSQDESATDAAWYPVDELPQLPFDHGRMVADGLERLRGKLWYSNVAVGLLPPQFTLTQARRLYQAISGTDYEANNFRRRLQNTDLVQATSRTVSDGPGKPAELYEFVEHRPAWGRGPRGFNA